MKSRSQVSDLEWNEIILQERDRNKGTEYSTTHHNCLLDLSGHAQLLLKKRKISTSAFSSSSASPSNLSYEHDIIKYLHKFSLPFIPQTVDYRNYMNESTSMIEEYLITPFIPHAPLSIKRSNVDLIGNVKCMRDIWSILTTLHSCNILYNDWKPEHILFNSFSSVNNQYSLVDYDLCTFIPFKSVDNSTSLLNDGHKFIGSPYYSSLLSHSQTSPSPSSDSTNLLHLLYHVFIADLPWLSDGDECSDTSTDWTIQCLLSQTQDGLIETNDLFDSLSLIIDSSYSDLDQQRNLIRLINRKELEYKSPSYPFSLFHQSFLHSMSADHTSNIYQQRQIINEAFELFIKTYFLYISDQYQQYHSVKSNKLYYDHSLDLIAASLIQLKEGNNLNSSRIN